MTHDAIMPSRPGRRRFVRDAAGLALAPWLCSGKAYAAAPRVLVIGAGMAGLYAAWRLQALGCEVTVLEAAARIGGRNFTLRAGDLLGDRFEAPQRVEFAAGMSLDAGPWRLPPTHRRLRALIEALGLTLAPLPIVGQHGLLHIVGGMDRLPQALAGQLRTPVALSTHVVALERTRTGVRVQAQTPSGARTFAADFALLTVPPGRLLPFAEVLGLAPDELHQVQRQDAIKIAAPLIQSPADPLPARVGATVQRLLPSAMPGLGVIYGQQPALDGPLLGPRAHQAMLGRRWLGVEADAPALVLRFAALPEFDAAFEAAPPALVRRLRAGRPPFFFAGDALSEFNGWQEGALASVDQALSAIDAWQRGAGRDNAG